MRRRLGADERALWAKVVATVSPLHPDAIPVAEAVAPAPLPPSAPQGRPAAVRRPPPASPAPPRPHSANTLDGSWDRRVARGLLQPDASIDLHGHTLGSAHALLDARLEQAVARGARVLLLITGKPPRDEERPVKRGAIRAAVADWLAASRHAGAIAAVRGAHPRHGGTGALYLILKRPK